MTKKIAPHRFPLLPLRGTLVFPHMVTPFEVGRARSIQAVEQALMGDRRIVLAAQHQAAVDEPQPSDIYTIGTLCEIKQILKMPEGQLRILVEGLERVIVHDLADREGYYEATISVPEVDFEEERRDHEVMALVRSVHEHFQEYVRLSKKIPGEVVGAIKAITDPGRLADTVIGQLNVELEEKQQVLEIFSPFARLERVLGVLYRELEIVSLEKTIQQRVRKQMDKAQREYYLREQMRAIQKELGEGDDRASEAEELRQKLNKAKLPKEARAKVLHEIKRLEKMPPMAAESGVIRTYVDWMISLPWSKRTPERLDLAEAERILERDHYGLKQVKERILEFLAVRKLAKNLKAPILCFVGPPGVGKTSLASSIAEALGRKFTRLSLGGVRDEAEIRGHRRTYIGALPGKIIQAMKNVGTKNPVILLDEVDKLGADFRGDPSSALLEVLDPEQNDKFGDHYVDVPFDLSEVLFITTANVLYSIPAPLRDRMEVIEIPGYTDDEKLQIAKGHLWPKQLQNHGLSAEQVRISDNTILKIISEYTREAGVRNLERMLGTICRKVAAEVVRGSTKPVRVTVNNLSKFLGTPRYRHTEAEQEDRVGVANGLAYTQLGGEIMPIEVTVVPGKGKVTLTGKLGEVMRESAQAALSYLRSRAEDWGIDPEFHEKCDIHMHIPEGAVPKDGPSAGITIAVALASALTDRPVRHDLSMTGEITLRGRILPIGGVKEKLLAAHRAGIDTVLLPEENARDLQDVPENILRSLQIELVEHMDEVITRALLPKVESDDSQAPKLPFLPQSELPAETWVGDQQ
ncbi:MAG: endopeptidase La [Firmicutes bacterium]|nr:endopeptidase La [Bacillota bacterium]